MNKIIDLIKYIMIGVKTWRQALIIISIASSLTALTLIGFWSYSMIERNKNLELLAGVKAIKLSRSQELEISRLVDPLVDHTGVREFYVRVLQPDDLIKKTSSELVYGRTESKSWEVVQTYHWSKLIKDLSDTPSTILKLNKIPVYRIEEGDDSYIGDYLASIEHDYLDTYVHGMYYKNLLIGYCVVMISESEDGHAGIPESVLIKIDKTVRSINRIIFR